MKDNAPFAPGSVLLAYLRDSGGIEQEASTDQQELVIRQWCTENGYSLTRVYKDAAAPGSSAVDRKQFQAMIAHFHDDAPEAGLVVWKFSRFARNLDDAQFYRADLRRRGYEIYSLKDTIPSGPEGRFFEAAIDWMNERYLMDLSVDIQRGLESNRRDHGCMTGTPPVGYKRQPVQIGTHRDGSPRLASRWVPDDRTAPLVRQAFKMRAAGESYKAIHDRLRLHASMDSYGYTFRNPIYIGHLRVNGELQHNFVEPIIDQAVWQTVQDQARKIDAVWAHPRRRNSRFLLSGLASCGVCGRHLSGYTMHHDGTAYDYYRCNGVYVCVPQFSAPKQQLEQTILQQVQQTLAEAGLAEHLYQQQSQHLQSGQTERDALSQQARSDLAGVEKRIARIVSAIADGGHSQALLAELRNLEKQRDDLRARLDQVPPLFAGLALDEIQHRIENAALVLQSGEYKKVRTVLLNLISSLVLVRDGKQVRGQLSLFMPMSVDSPESISIHLNFTLDLRSKSHSISTHIDRQ